MLKVDKLQQNENSPTTNHSNSLIIWPIHVHAIIRTYLSVRCGICCSPVPRTCTDIYRHLPDASNIPCARKFADELLLRSNFSNSRQTHEEYQESCQALAVLPHDVSSRGQSLSLHLPQIGHQHITSFLFQLVMKDIWQRFSKRDNL